MAFLELRCSKCGGTLKEKGNVFECGYCHTTYLNDQIEKETAALRAILDEQKQEQLANRRHMLWEAIHAEYIDSEMIVDLCRSLRKLKPDDFEARFFEVANSGNGRELNRFIDSIDVKNPEEKFWAEEVVKFTIKSLRAENILSLNDLIERAYKNTDLEKYEKYATHVSDEAKKVEGGIYEPSLPRDVFVMYSSKDFKKVKELVYHLEESGLKCFVAMRNLQHGRGAVANYQRALETAMDNCKVIVFLSSRNSRALDCDAMRVEMPYLKRKDIENAPYEYRQHYDKMPQKYKKPRVEYRLDNEKTGGAGLVKEFFGELEFAYSADEVLNRVVQALTASVEEKPQEKICVSCGAKNALTAKFCNECGGKEFVSSKAELEAARLKKERAAHEEAEKKAAEAEREKQALLERLKALEAEKEEEKARKAQESETERKRKEEAELAAKLAREEEAKRRDEEARKRAEEAEKANQALLERLKKLEEAQRAPQPIVQAPVQAPAPVRRSAEEAYQEGRKYFNLEQYKKALPHLKEAAEQNHALALYFYGDALNFGYGIEQDKPASQEYFKKAVPLLDKAGQAGDAIAAYYYAEAYDYGWGVSEDKNQAQLYFGEAFELLKKKAYSQDPEIEWLLYTCYCVGRGTEKNDSLMTDFLKKAAEHGMPKAQYALGSRYGMGRGGLEKSPVYEATWYEKAAVQGHVSAMRDIGTKYLKGNGVSTNLYKGAEWLQKAVDHGDCIAMVDLAECYEKGLGVIKNRQKAIDLYVSSKGIYGASEGLKRLGYVSPEEQKRKEAEAKRKAEEEARRKAEEAAKAEAAWLAYSSAINRSGDVLYFGVYPQSKATPKSIGATDSNGYIDGGDGRYAKVNNGYYRVEPIKWNIVQETEDECLLVADKALDRSTFGPMSESKYEKSVVRGFLNGAFFSKAFNEKIRDRIQVTAVDNSAKSGGFTQNYASGGVTNDRIFLLSKEEVSALTAGKQKQATSFAIAKGVQAKEGENAYWWTRSPAIDRGKAQAVTPVGQFLNNLTGYDGYGVVPALRYKKTAEEKAAWEAEKKRREEEQKRAEEEAKRKAEEAARRAEEEKARLERNAEILKNGGMVREGNKMYFGFYPQKSSGAPEPIKWGIAEEKDGEVLLIAENTLDLQPFNKRDNSNYLTSYIRDWLNNDFLNRAFSNKAQEKILKKEVDNSAASTGYPSNRNASVNTTDKVFLPSIVEMRKYCTGGRKPTDYTKSIGDHHGGVSDTAITRSPTPEKFSSFGQLYDGIQAIQTSIYTNVGKEVKEFPSVAAGILPAMWVLTPEGEKRRAEEEARRAEEERKRLLEEERKRKAEEEEAERKRLAEEKKKKEAEQKEKAKLAKAQNWYTQGKALIEKKQYTSGMPLIRQAVDLGHANAMCLLGKCYLEGTGTNRDEERGEKLLQNAAFAGVQEANKVLGKYYYERGHMYENQRNISNAKLYLTKASNIDQEKAQECRKELDIIEFRMRVENRCVHCGGKFKGLFTKTCADCGRKKDY